VPLLIRPRLQLNCSARKKAALMSGFGNLAVSRQI
jgi:hypothetical protein